MLTYAHVCSRMLTSARVCWRMLTYADVCWRMLTNLIDESHKSGLMRNFSRMLTYAHVCSRMLTYARVCWRMLTYALISLIRILSYEILISSLLDCAQKQVLDCESTKDPLAVRRYNRSSTTDITKSRHFSISLLKTHFAKNGLIH
jgi:hypothetical protein